MTYANSIPGIQSLGKFVQLISGPSGFLTVRYKSVVGSAYAEEDGAGFPSKDFPLPDKEEVNPNPEIPEEEEYLPDEEEVPVEEPQKEIEDPSFPGKGDDLPPIEEEEFPKTDPV
ncbi:hypothetical protein [uncultured Algoriphagus sp.]|uniref:hypothetical protein n=1 Tax=uncultured Algoriphagus sp. TaxID=417365 RepID=UPI0030EE5D56|tara:strand:+ start:5461 stop:5805 length:345 start_codon:yes stop_codon:yes gene_type:complete